MELYKNFNPRTREGCDLPFFKIHERQLVISIHAPVKGATFDVLHGRARIRVISIHAPVKGATNLARQPMEQRIDFNPRTREGCDSTVESGSVYTKIHFNPRTREGCDAQCQAWIDNIGLDFNPRTREGCDFRKSWKSGASAIISIHAPVKGATRHLDNPRAVRSIFQSTHP